MQTTEITLHGLRLEVKWNYIPAERGARGSWGEPLEPDYPAEAEMIEIYHHGEEVLCIMDDAAISKARDLVLAQEGE